MRFCRLAVPLAAVFLIAASVARAEPAPHLIPKPAELSAIPGCRVPAGVILAAIGSAKVDPGGLALLRERYAALGIEAVKPGNYPVKVQREPQLRHVAHYELNVHADGLAIRSGTTDGGEGGFDALATLAQLASRTGSAWTVPCVDIVDEAALRWRILSDDVSRGPLPTMRYFEERIRTIASFKMNGYSPYVEHVFVDPKHPLPAPLDGITPAELHELAMYAARYHVAFVPEQQTFAHMHETLKLEQYAPLAELPHGYLLSPENPAGEAYVRDLIRDELAALPAPPPFFHIGSDEPSDLGRGISKPLVDARGDGPVYADHVVKTADFVIANHGGRPMIWDDAIAKHPELFGELTKQLVFVNWHYGSEATYQPYIDRIAHGGFDQLIAPGALNWNEIYPDIDTALPNIDRFVSEGKASHVLGLFQTVWHDDGETLFEATWYPVAYAAASAWEADSVDRTRFASDFPAAFFGTDDARYADDIAALGRCRSLLAKNPREYGDYLFWADPFSADLANVPDLLDLSALRLSAERAMEHLRLATPPLHRNAAAVMALAARRYDALGREYQIPREARAYYDDARANAGTHDGFVYRGLNVAKYLFWEERDAMLALEPQVRAAWDYEDRPSHEESVLERYHLAAQRAIERSDALSAAVYRDYIAKKDTSAVRRRARASGIAVTGLLMIAIFAIAAALMYARVLPALLAVPLMALAIAAVAGAGWVGLASTVTDGTVKLAPVIVTVIFGALLSRVTLATGIAETIVAYAAEFGGDRPAVLALALCAAVALLFTSLTGLGAIIMVGSIVLPIMMTIGVPRKTAATLFLLAFALGFIFNIAQWTFYTTTFGVERAVMQPYAYALAAIDFAVLVVFAGVRFRSARGYATWAMTAEEPLARKRAPFYALLTPVLPIVLYFAAHINPIVAFALCAVYGVLTTRPRKAIETLVAAAIRGAEDVAPAVWLFMGIGMLLVATGLPSVKAALLPVVAAIAPRSWLGYIVLFGVLSPLALYRGPLNPFGVGIVVYTVLAGLGVLPAVVLVAAIMAVVQVQNVCDPTNTQNVWVANFTGTSVEEITKLTLPFQTGVAILATISVVVFGTPLLGVRPFTSGAPAAAAEIAPPPGLYAPAPADDTIAVEAGPGPDSPAAADEVVAEFGRSWDGMHGLAYSGDPGAGDCAAKPFAAFVRVTATPYDVGLELTDCAGWPVNQWYVDRSSDVRQSALAAVFRMRTWTVDHPALAQTLFSRGLAFDPANVKASYYYSLFKSSDGQMRAFVRPGGPAYVAGMRTNDIVEKLDGKFWWEYGTFQTQARAYDGKPHVFLVQRAKAETTVTLGAPFTPAP